MTLRFIPCASCARHVKESDAVCPFCGEKTVWVAAPPPRVPGARMSRSALFAGAVGAALASSSCSSSSSEGAPSPVEDASRIEDAKADVPSPQPLYGAPVDARPPVEEEAAGGDDGPDVGTPPVPPQDASADAPIVFPAYGSPFPPPDAGKGGNGDQDAADGAKAIAMYGAPPVPDAG
jgi:hypothetical protein